METMETTAPVTMPAETLPEDTSIATEAWVETTPATEIVEVIEVVEMVDYRPVIEESTSVLANFILCGALMIVGVLVSFKFWEAK